jgi:copper chaperone CopZ
VDKASSGLRRPWVIPRRLRTLPAVTLLRRDATGAELRVDGLVCAACAARVRSRLAALPGVRAVAVDLSTGVATVDCDEDVPFQAMESRLRGAVLLPGLRRLLARPRGAA